MNLRRIGPAWVSVCFIVGLAAPVYAQQESAAPAPAAEAAKAPTTAGEENKPKIPSRAAHKLDVKLLAPQRVERLSKPAREAYDQGVKSLDKILLTKALDEFKSAVEAEPDNVFLRFIVVQVAQYLGETRAGDESIADFDIAIDNLKYLVDSPKLNAREQERARAALEAVTELRESIPERDASRQAYGLEIAKQYASEIYHDKKKDKDLNKAKERDAAKAQFKDAMRAAGQFGQNSTAEAAPTPAATTPEAVATPAP